jgi:MtrB/PioB family decaheme-associated outer membrane protein
VTADDPFDPGNPDVAGRAATAPSNWAQSLSLSGAGTLPLGVSNRVSASFVYGYRYQDDGFQAHTINPAFANDPSLVLPSSGLDGQVQTLLGNLLATVQPAENLSAKLRYRIYDFNNKTDSLFFPGNVRNDGQLRAADPHRSVANDYTRQNADLDLAWDFARSWTGVLGFGFEYWDRSDDREVEHLYDYGPRLKVDYRTLGGTLLHAGYEFRNRYGSNYKALAPLDAIFAPPPQSCDNNPNKFCRVRKFDQADRYLHRFDLLAQFLPREDLELTFTGNMNYSDYHNSSFGLTEDLGWSVGSDAFYQLHSRVGLMVYYTYEWRKFWQDSRNRPRTFGAPPVVTDDWVNNWDSRTRYQYHNAGAVLSLGIIPEKLDTDLEYLINYGEEKTRSSGKPGVAGPNPAAEAVDWPRVHDRLQAVSSTVSWHFSDRVTLRGGYRFEKYDVSDFRQNNIPSSLVDSNGNLYLGDVAGDYTAHIFQIGAVLRF